MSSLCHMLHTPFSFLSSSDFPTFLLRHVHAEREKATSLWGCLFLVCSVLS